MCIESPALHQATVDKMPWKSDPVVSLESDAGNKSSQGPCETTC